MQIGYGVNTSAFYFGHVLCAEYFFFCFSNIITRREDEEIKLCVTLIYVISQKETKTEEGENGEEQKTSTENETGFDHTTVSEAKTNSYKN